MKAKQETQLRPEHIYQEPIRKEDFEEKLTEFHDDDSLGYGYDEKMGIYYNINAYLQALKAQEKPEPEWKKIEDAKPEIKEGLWSNLCLIKGHEGLWRMRNEENNYWYREDKGDCIYSHETQWCYEDDHDQKLNTWIEGRVQFENWQKTVENEAQIVFEKDRFVLSFEHGTNKTFLKEVGRSGMACIFPCGISIAQFIALTGLEQIDYGV